MFNTAASFRAAMTGIAAVRGLRHIYVAAHGDTDAIYGAGGNHRVPLNIILQSVQDVASTPQSTLSGIYFGACAIGRERTAHKLLGGEHGEQAGLKWIAGYSKDADWTTSSAVDFVFWDSYLRAVDPDLEALSDHKAVFKAAETVGRLMSGAVDLLGFNVYVRERGAVRGLLA